MIDVRNPDRANEIVDLAVERLKAAKHWGLAPHAPFTASSNLYERCQELARRESILPTTHLAESREEMQMFRNASGPLYDFLKEIGRDMSDCGEKTPVAHFLSMAAGNQRATEVSRPCLIVHLNELIESDYELLERWRSRFSIVHCPRSHTYFEHSPFPFERLREIGFNICLGTDSLASNEDLSLFGEMRVFRENFANVSAEEILAMVTRNSARALSREGKLGKIAEEFAADLIAIPCERPSEVFEEILVYAEPIAWSMLNGTLKDRP